MDLLLFLLHGRVLLSQRFFLLLNGLQLAVQVFFLLLQTVFLPLQIGSAGFFFLLVISTAFQDLFLGFQQRFFSLGLGALDGFVDNAPSFFFSVGDFLFIVFYTTIPSKKVETRSTDQKGNNAYYDFGLHISDSFLSISAFCPCKTP